MHTHLAAAPPSLYYPATERGDDFIGLPRLMELAFRGVDMEPLRDRLVARLQRQRRDARALMDLSNLMSISGQADLAARLQAEALSVSRRYTLAAQGTEALRVLTLMTPGNLMANMPIEFLLHGSDVTLEMVYVDPLHPGLGLKLPPHDVACIGVCEAPEARALLQALAAYMPALPRPTLNDPRRVLRLAREQLWRVLEGVPGCLTPPSACASRDELQQLAAGSRDWDGVLPGAALPLICRPQGSHAGQGLARIDSREALTAFLAATPGEAFVLSSFVDYRGSDGQYRKYRIAFVGGRPWPVHLALSSRWMVHYLNGDMADRPDNRAEEQRFFDDFAHGFGQRHAAALAQLDERLGLDYYSIDCGETPDGRLLVFECDTGGVVHAMDALEDFGYKRAHMLALFAAFRALLARAASDPGVLRPRLPAGPLH